MLELIHFLVISCGKGLGRSWILPGCARVGRGKGRGGSWILPGWAGFRMGKERFGLTRSIEEGLGGLMYLEGRILEYMRSLHMAMCHYKLAFQI